MPAQVLWLTGAVGAGKSDDEHNHAVKAAVLGATWPVFRSRGTIRLVLAGGIETADRCDRYRAQVPDGESFYDGVVDTGDVDRPAAVERVLASVDWR